MKKLFLLLFLSVPGLMVAQDNFGSVKFGMYNPSASDAGFIIGYAEQLEDSCKSLSGFFRFRLAGSNLSNISNNMQKKKEP